MNEWTNSPYVCALALSMHVIAKHKSYLHLEINLSYAFHLWKDIKSHCQKPQMSPIYFVSSFSLSAPELLLPWVHVWLILSEKSCPLFQSSSVQANDLQHSNLNFLPDLGIHLASLSVCAISLEGAFLTTGPPRKFPSDIFILDFIFLKQIILTWQDRCHAEGMLLAEWLALQTSCYAALLQENLSTKFLSSIMDSRTAGN